MLNWTSLPKGREGQTLLILGVTPSDKNIMVLTDWGRPLARYERFVV
jgi:hypothetical protein